MMTTLVSLLDIGMRAIALSSHALNKCDALPNKPISEATKALIEKLMLERVSLRAIVRITGVSLQWLQSYVNGQFRATSRNLEVSIKKSPLTIQCDEMWSFVSNKGNKQWVWIANNRPID